MCIQFPITKEEMQHITGVGMGKAQKYGEPFLKIIKTYVDENEISRPNDMVVKSVANKSISKYLLLKVSTENFH